MSKGIHDLPLNYNLTYGHEMQFHAHAPEGTDVSQYIPIGKGMMINLVNEAGFNSIPHMVRQYNLEDGTKIVCTLNYGVQRIDIYPTGTIEGDPKIPRKIIARYYDTVNWKDGFDKITTWQQEGDTFKGINEVGLSYGEIDWVSTNKKIILTYERGTIQANRYGTPLLNPYGIRQGGSRLTDVPMKYTHAVAVYKNKLVVIGYDDIDVLFIHIADLPKLKPNRTQPFDLEWTEILEYSMEPLGATKGRFHFNSTGTQAACI